MTHQLDQLDTEHDEADKTTHLPSFWRSRDGKTLLAVVAVGGLLLGYEHRVHVLDSGLLIWLPLLLCVGMHFFMHGGHGGHGGHGEGNDR